MNIYVKKAFIGLLSATLLVGVLPATTTFADSTANDNQTTPSGIAISELESKVDEYVKDYIGESTPGAAVVVVKNNEVILSKGYGKVDPDSDAAVEPDKTLFHYDSLSELYTWTAIHQLVDQGLLNLDEDILTYLPEDLASELKKHLTNINPITLTHLMNHTAGFDELGHDTSFTDDSKLQKDLKESLLTTMPNQIYGPGQVMTADSYSATLAAYIVEQVSGTSFIDYVQSNILSKLGDEHTVFMQNASVFDKVKNELAVSYTKDSEGNFTERKQTYSNLYPTDSVCGTANDLAKLMTQLMKGKESSLLSPTSLDTMYSKSYAISDEAKASLHGLYEFPDEVNAYYYNGGTSSTTMMVMMPESDFGVVIATNANTSLEFLFGLSDFLITSNEPEKVTGVDNLPGVSFMTDREYVGSKRPYGGALEFAGYFSNCSKFTRIDQHTISLGDDQYIQVAPYVYRYSGDSESPLYKTLASTIYFSPDSSGYGYKWSYSACGAAEYVNSPNNKTQQTISMTTFLLVVFIMFIIGAVLFSIIGLIRDAIKHRFNWKGVKLAYTIFVVLLLASVFNNYSALSDMSSLSGAMASSINVHIIFNIILTILELGSLSYLIIRLRNERQTIMRNITIIFTAVIYIFSFYFLQTWNFYTLM